MSLKLIIIMSAVILIELLVIVISILCNKSLKKEKNILMAKVEVQKQNLLYFYKHVEELAVIEKDKKHFEKTIKDTKNDEEILDVINTIISINNSKLQNSVK